MWGALDILRRTCAIEGRQFDCRILSSRYNTKNLLLLISVGEQQFVAKCATAGSYAAVRLGHEVRWYEKIRSQEAIPIHQYIPRYLGSYTCDHVSVLLLEYIPHTETARDAFLKGKLGADDVIRYLGTALSLFGVKVDCYSELEQTYLQENLYKRLNTRLESLRRVITGDNDTADIWERDISVNGLPKVSLATTANWLIRTSKHMLQPEFAIVGMTHGDLHLENILMQANGAFYMIDPNAKVGPIPIYDIGKMLHSTFGYYDLIHTGNAQLRISNPHEMHLRFAPVTLLRYLELNEKFKRLLRDLIQNDTAFNYLYAQMNIVCLIHFMCLLPHHFDKRSVFYALTARTLELFHIYKAYLDGS